MTTSAKAALFNWPQKEIMITGGSGSLGRTILRKLLTDYHPKGIRIYSRDEFKQWELQNDMKSWNVKGNVSFLIGDIRDAKRLDRACNGVHLIFNTAAMKQVPACEYNPIEAVRTNIEGNENLINAALNNFVQKVMHVSTDKAVYPINLYGATKTVAEKLFIHSNVYGGSKGTKFSCCRYGNVLGSRGSIIPLFRKQAENGVITVTDKRMTRFWITLNQVADFIINNAMAMEGEEIFIPKMPSMLIMDMIEVLAPDCRVSEIGIRKGEKLHECLITGEEAMQLIEKDDMFVIYPNREIFNLSGKAYYSDTNSEWVTKEKMKTILEENNL